MLEDRNQQAIITYIFTIIKYLIYRGFDMADITINFYKTVKRRRTSILSFCHFCSAAEYFFEIDRKVLKNAGFCILISILIWQH